MPKNRIVAVVPAYEQESLIARTVIALRSVPGVWRVIVVDDGSSDLTAYTAGEAGAEVVVNGLNIGKGRSLNRVLREVDFDILLLIDGDLGYSASQAEALLVPVLSGVADLAIAAFPASRRKGGFGLAQGAGRWGIRKMTGFETASPLSGQRAMNRELYDAVMPLDPGFGVEVGMTIDAVRSGLKVVEVVTTMEHRETGRDLAGFMHRGHQFLDIIISVGRRIGSGGR